MEGVDDSVRVGGFFCIHDNRMFAERAFYYLLKI